MANVIRYAIRDDVDRVVELMRESHQAAGFEFEFIESYARALFFHHLSNDTAACIVLDLSGVVEGVLMCAYGQHPFGAGRVAKETLWYISKRGRGGSAFKMLKEYENWSVSHKCDIISMASLVSNDVSAIYNKLGYKPLEVHFIKAL